MNDQQLGRYAQLAHDLEQAAFPAYDMGAAARKAVPALVMEVCRLQADNVDLRRQVADLEELLRREEARG